MKLPASVDEMDRMRREAFDAGATAMNFAYDRAAVWGELREMDRLHDFVQKMLGKDLHADLAEALDLLRLVCTFADDGVAFRRCRILLERHKEKP